MIQKMVASIIGNIVPVWYHTAYILPLLLCISSVHIARELDGKNGKNGQVSRKLKRNMTIILRVGPIMIYMELPRNVWFFLKKKKNNTHRLINNAKRGMLCDGR